MNDNTNQKVLELSARVWEWMTQRDEERLREVIATEAVFVHMGVTLDKQGELDTVSSGRILYREFRISEASARRVGDTVIVLTTMELTAEVDGTVVTNPFVTTSVFAPVGGRHLLAALAFTRTLTR